MCSIFFDLGVKNFCYLICEIVDNELKIIDFSLVNLKNLIHDVILLLNNLTEQYKFQNIFVESQNYHNTKCIKIETVILTYLTLNNLPFKKVIPSKKLKLLNIDSTSYSIRKKGVVNLGEKILSCTPLPKNLNEKLINLKKKDDFYDCFLMAITELPCKQFETYCTSK